MVSAMATAFAYASGKTAGVCWREGNEHALSARLPGKRSPATATHREERIRDRTGRLLMQDTQLQAIAQAVIQRQERYQRNTLLFDQLAQLLARGRPVAPELLARRLHRNLDEVRSILRAHPELEYDAQGEPGRLRAHACPNHAPVSGGAAHPVRLVRLRHANLPGGAAPLRPGHLALSGHRKQHSAHGHA